MLTHKTLRRVLKSSLKSKNIIISVFARGGSLGRGGGGKSKSKSKQVSEEMFSLIDGKLHLNRNKRLLY